MTQPEPLGSIRLEELLGQSGTPNIDLDGFNAANRLAVIGIQMTGTETYSFGEWLKQRRERLRLTQRELVDTVHCSVAMIKKVEADEHRPSHELAELLAISLKVPEPDQEIFGVCVPVDMNGGKWTCGRGMD